MKIEINKKDKCIDIYSPIGIGYSKEYPYRIYLISFEEEWQLLSWIKHLHEKIWWDSDLVDILIRTWEKVNDKKIGDA